MVFGQQNSSFDLARETEHYELKDGRFYCLVCRRKDYAHLRKLRQHLRTEHQNIVYGDGATVTDLEETAGIMNAYHIFVVKVLPVEMFYRS